MVFLIAVNDFNEIVEFKLSIYAVIGQISYKITMDTSATHLVSDKQRCLDMGMVSTLCSRKLSG